MAKKTSWTVYLVALALFAGGLGYIVTSSLAENKVYFLNVGEALGKPVEELRAVRLFGTVVEGYTRAGLGVRFQLQDAEMPGRVMWVDYKGAVPDTFQPGAEVIVEGGMGHESFDAKTLMTKCPSKYEKDNRGDMPTRV